MFLYLAPFPVPGGEYLIVPSPDEECGGDWDSVGQQPGVGGGGGSLHGGVQVGAGEGEEGTNSEDKIISGVENRQAWV